nr:unnamed protein product [Digitaria exilis]
MRTAAGPGALTGGTSAACRPAARCASSSSATQLLDQPKQLDVQLVLKKTKTNLNKWAVEVAESGTFSAHLGSGGPGGLPVPYLVIANKVDIA